MIKTEMAYYNLLEMNCAIRWKKVDYNFYLNMKIRYIIGIAYLSYIGMMGGTIIVEAIIVGLVLGMYDFLFNDRIV